MSIVSFAIKNNGPQKPASIYLRLSCSDGRLKYYISENVNPGDWPGKIPRPVRAQMVRVESHIGQMAADYKLTGKPLTKAAVKASLDRLLNKRVIADTLDMFEAMTRVVDEMEVGKRLTPGKKRYSPGSIKTFRFTITLLQRFNPGLSIAGTSLDTYYKFIRWMHGESYSTNYIGSQIKNWKTLGKSVGGSGIFDDPGFKKIQEETHDIYLDEYELARLYKLKLTGREEVVRDWFIIDCFTGLRVSDLVLLDKKNYSRGMITIANEKTDERVVIPAHKYVKAILEKWKGFPRAATDVEINRTIKGIAEKAEINQDVLFTITKGGRRKDEYLKKWQMVSCHTSRRSFITNLRKNGVPDSIVMNLTGIRSAATLKRYDRLGPDEAARIAAKHKFFK